MDIHNVVSNRYLRYQMLALTCRGQATADGHQALADAAIARDIKQVQQTLGARISEGVAHALKSTRLLAL